MADIRPAVNADATQIAAFWNPIIRDTVVTFSTQEKTEDGIADMISSQPFYVAVDGETVLGFATYSQFRGGNGYRKTMEHTIVLAPVANGQGIGRVLMKTIENDAESNGYHIMVAGVTAENAAGIAFHKAVGYEETGYMPEAGYKFGRYLDLMLLQKKL